MHRLIVRQVKGAERFVVSLSDGRSAEDEARVASPVAWAMRAGSGKLSGECTGHQPGPGCPQQHADQEPAPVNRSRAETRRAIHRGWKLTFF